MSIDIFAAPTDIAQTPVAPLDATAARALTTQLQGLLDEALMLLRAAFEGRAWAALGYDSWAAYVDVELAGFSLPPEMALTTARELRAAGWSHRAIAAPLHMSEPTVRRQTKDVIPGQVIGADGRTYAGAERPAMKAIAAAKTDLALQSLALAATEGLTGPELGKKRRWDHGRYSATLTRLHQQNRVVRLATRRGAYCIYVLPEHVAGRRVIPLGRRSPLPTLLALTS